MLAFAIVTMAAARNPNNEGYISDSKGRGSLSPGGGGGGGGSANNKSWRAHGVPGRGGRRKRPPPRPNHFLSVRIDNASIWENVLAVQEDIVDSQPHLKEAAIPVQDLHLTLFVATLHEQDGSLQRAKEALQSAGDILLGHGLSSESSGTTWNSAKTNAQGEQLRLRPTRPSLACGDELPATLEDAVGATSLSDPHGVRFTGVGVDGGGDGGDGDGGGGRGGDGGGDNGLVAPTIGDVVSPSDPKETKLLGGVDGDTPRGALEGQTSPPPAPSSAASGAESTMSLSFRGLGTFNDKVLYAHLVEDGQAARLRSLASALHARFSEARLVDAAPSRSGHAEKEDRPFDFQPHLTIMKTSKLRDRRTLIPPSSHSRHRELVFGSHSPVAVELSSMLEREEAVADGDGESRPYYKCMQKLDLRNPAS